MPNALEELAKALAPIMASQNARQFGLGQKHNVSGSPISVGYSHGPGGVLSFPGVDPTVFNNVLGPTSILGEMPTSASNQTNPTYLTITGVQDVTGSEPAGVCDDGPVAGLMKACMTTAPFGRYTRQTAQLDLSRIGKVNDRADPMDLQLVGTPIASSGIFGNGAQNASAPGDVFTNEVSRKFWELNVSLYRLLARQVWQGRPANNNAGGGYKEVTGIDLLVSTGYKDAEMGTLCPAVDSYVVNFGHGRIDANGANTVAAITNMWWQVNNRADRLSLTPVRWVFAMRRQMFYELTAIWPCAYLSWRCNAIGNGATEFIDAQDAVRFRDEMRTGRYLLIDGQRVDVIVDDGIAELNGNNGAGAFARGCFESSIYLLPMSVVGGRAVTYLEYFQYDNAAVREAIGNMALARVEGAFLTWPKQTNNCITWQTLVEPRVVLRTPYLAAKLTNVAYCPIDHERDAFPNDPYFVNGGKTSRPGPSYFSHWQS